MRPRTTEIAVPAENPPGTLPSGQSDKPSRMAEQGQIIAQHENRDGREHQYEANPKTPIAMGALPIGRFNVAARVMFRALVSVVACTFVHLPHLARR